MTLPLLLSVPHAGLQVPDEVAALCLLTPYEVAQDGDVGAAEIYDLGRYVKRYVTTDLARAVVDMNRARGDFRKDGVIKTHTCWDVPIWRETPGPELVALLLSRHHATYHARLSEPDPEVLLAIDCHTMAAFGPPVGPDPGQQRPAVCLSDADGTLPGEWFERLARCFKQTCEGQTVSLNHPFQGGYVIREHARERPWVQLELSRAPWDTGAGKRRRVREALELWCAETIQRGSLHRR